MHYNKNVINLPIISVNRDNKFKCILHNKKRNAKLYASHDSVKLYKEMKERERINDPREEKRKKLNVIGKSWNLKFKINQENELNYIKSLLGNDGIPDQFYLSEPRWREKKHVLKVPGPAYYFGDFTYEF